MCLSKAYLTGDGGTELVLEEVSSLKIEGEKLLLGTLLGEQKEIVARIREIDFLKHRITLEKI
jgi:predicted RNA-binding protein